MNIPINSPVGFIGLVLLGLGVFFVLAGLDIFSIQQITVHKGKRTWGIGIIFVISGIVLLYPEATNSLNQYPTPLVSPDDSTSLKDEVPFVSTPTTKNLLTPIIYDVPTKKSDNPSFGKIDFCLEENFNKQTQKCEKPQNVFSTPLKTIYMSWSCHNCNKGIKFHQEWRWNGKLDNIHSSSEEKSEIWKGGETEFTYISGETIYLPYGKHQVELYIEGKSQQTGYFTIERSFVYKVTDVPLNDTLAIRSTPGVSNPKVGDIPPNGTDIEVLGATHRVNGSIWVPIKYEQITGWIHSGYITEHHVKNTN